MCEKRIKRSDVVGWSDAGIDRCGGSWEITPNPPRLANPFNAAGASGRADGRHLFGENVGKNKTQHAPMEYRPMEFENKTCNSCYGDLVNVFKSLPSGWSLDGNMYIPAVAEEGYVAPWCLPVGHANAASCCIPHVHTPKKCPISFWRIVVALGLRADPCSATRSPSTPVFCNWRKCGHLIHIY